VGLGLSIVARATKHWAATFMLAACLVKDASSRSNFRECPLRRLRRKSSVAEHVSMVPPVRFFERRSPWSFVPEDPTVEKALVQ
jgi:hypothetical protein